MISSRFNYAVPVPERDEWFIVNTLTGSQAFVSADVVELLRRLETDGSIPDTDGAGQIARSLQTLSELGFVVADRVSEHESFERWLKTRCEDTSQLSIVVSLTEQCNFACEYCYQGDHKDCGPETAMTPGTATRVANWIEDRFQAIHPKRFFLTFFGGEPLLNLRVMYYLAERLWKSAGANGITMSTSVVTNGLLLKREVVQRLKEFGLSEVKVTLDGEREVHDHQRPLRGGQGTFDKIVDNLGSIAAECPISIGGNFDNTTFESCRALVSFLRNQQFRSRIAFLSFMPIVRKGIPAGIAPRADGDLDSTHGAAEIDQRSEWVDTAITTLREEAKRQGFVTRSPETAIFAGPCDFHKQNSVTIGTDGLIYKCSGFLGDRRNAVGHVDSSDEKAFTARAQDEPALPVWRLCGECPFVPACLGGCRFIGHFTMGDRDSLVCHKQLIERAVLSLAYEKAGLPLPM